MTIAGVSTSRRGLGRVFVWLTAKDYRQNDSSNESRQVGAILIERN